MGNEWPADAELRAGNDVSCLVIEDLPLKALSGGFTHLYGISLLFVMTVAVGICGYRYISTCQGGLPPLQDHRAGEEQGAHRIKGVGRSIRIALATFMQSYCFLPNTWKIL